MQLFFRTKLYNVASVSVEEFFLSFMTGFLLTGIYPVQMKNGTSDEMSEFDCYTSKVARICKTIDITV